MGLDRIHFWGGVGLSFNWKTFFPLASFIGGIVTIILTVVIWFSFPHFDEGWGWPPLSMVGREVPSFYIFSTGFTVTGVFVVCFAFQYLSFLNQLQTSFAVTKKNVWEVPMTIGFFLAGLNLAFLALTNHREVYYSKIAPHIITTLVMFFAALTACVCGYKALSHVRLNAGDDTIGRSKEGSARAMAYLDRLILLKLRVMMLLGVAVMVHVPAGYILPGIMCKGKTIKISMNDCKETFDLASDYCEAWMSSTNSSMTRLNNNKCGGWLILASVTQHILIVVLLLVILTFAFDLSFDLKEKQAGNEDDSDQKPLELGKI
jgi:hypothetical protein